MANSIAVTEIGINAMTVTAANPTVTVPAGGVPRGAQIVVAFVIDGATTETGVTDTAGNPYTLTNAVTFNTSSDRLRKYVGYAKTALVSGNTVQVTIATGSILQIQAFYFTGGAWGEYNAALDTPAVSKSNAATATAITGPAIGPTKQADAIIVGAFAWANATGTFTPTAPWVQTGLTNKVSSNTFSLAVCYQIVTAVGTYTPTATLGTTSVYGASTIAIRASMARLLQSGAAQAVIRGATR